MSRNGRHVYLQRFPSLFLLSFSYSCLYFFFNRNALHLSCLLFRNTTITVLLSMAVLNFELEREIGLLNLFTDTFTKWLPDGMVKR